MVKIKLNMIKSYENKLSFVIRDSQRTKVIKIIDRRKTPTQIKKETNLSLNNISDILNIFKKIKIVRCINEKNITGRLYELTKEGEKIKKEIFQD